MQGHQITWTLQLFPARYYGSYRKAGRFTFHLKSPYLHFHIQTHVALHREQRSYRIAEKSSYPEPLCFWCNPFDVTRFIVMPRPYECGCELYRRMPDLFLKALFLTNRTENSIRLPLTLIFQKKTVVGKYTSETTPPNPPST
jgi:hypothetical protein